MLVVGGGPPQNASVGRVLAKEVWKRGVEFAGGRGPQPQIELVIDSRKNSMQDHRGHSRTRCLWLVLPPS